MLQFTEKELLTVNKSGKIYRIAPKCGTILAGGVAVWSWNDKEFYVVGQDAYYKFWSFQKAAVYGVKCIDYFVYKNAKAATKKANLLLALLQKPNV